MLSQIIKKSSYRQPGNSGQVGTVKNFAWHQNPLVIGDVRGSGLFLGIELVLDRETLEPAKKQAYDIAEHMKEEGILISIDGPLYNVIKIKPPLVFTEANADQYIDTLDKILGNI
jgi:4-aminobutyrate aminotransferase-like enzyme